MWGRGHNLAFGIRTVSEFGGVLVIRVNVDSCEGEIRCNWAFYTEDWNQDEAMKRNDLE